MTTKTPRELDAAEKIFLAGLLELTKRTGLILEGCGCCGSPSLGPSRQGVEGVYEYDRHIEFVPTPRKGKQ